MADPFDRLKSALADRYAIERELGAGGMATVYLAEDLKHHRKVAVKVLRPDLAAVLGSERFIREIEIAARLTHPHIVPLYDSGEADGFLFYVLPYIKGESLRAKLSHGELPVNEAVRILRDIADALVHAHGEGLVHRDIKPDNVLLSGHHAVVTDFGVAKAVSDATGRAQLTTAGVALGTPVYMAPEQAVADPNIDHRADIYALGVLAYEMLAGQPPFGGDSPQAVLSAHVTEAPKTVTDHRPAVPPLLADLIMRCLEKKPADRWQTTEEVLQQLEVATTPSGGITPIDTRPLQATVSGNKIKLPVIGGAIAVAAVVGALLVLPGGGSGVEPDRVIVAILDNETGDPQHDALGKMAQDWLTQGLLQTGMVQVVPTLTARQASLFVQSAVAQGERVDPVQALAEETGAGTVVWGAIYRDAGNLRFQMSVTDGGTGELIGALDPVVGPVDSASATIGVLREQLMGFLATTMDERLAGFVGAGGAAPTFEAYQAFSEGMDAYIRFDNAGALPHFLRAYELDSSYATSLVFASINLQNLGRFAEEDSLLEVLDRSRDRLSEYDRLWVDYLSRGLDGDKQGSLIAIRGAAEMAPGSKAVYNLALQARVVGRPQEAVDALRSLDPDREPMRGWTNYWYQLGWSLHHLSRDEEALEEVRRGRERHPESGTMLRHELALLAALGRVDEMFEVLARDGPIASPPQVAGRFVGLVGEFQAHGRDDAARQTIDSALAWFGSRTAEEREATWYSTNLAELLGGVERYGEAIALLEGLEREQPDNWFLRARRGAFQASLGDTTAALEVANELHNLEAPNLNDVNIAWMADIMQRLGRRDEAFSLLQQYLRQGVNHALVHVRIAPEWRRDDPRVDELLRPRG